MNCESADGACACNEMTSIHRFSCKTQHKRLVVYNGQTIDARRECNRFMPQSRWIKIIIFTLQSADTVNESLCTKMRLSDKQWIYKSRKSEMQIKCDASSSYGSFVKSVRTVSIRSPMRTHKTSEPLRTWLLFANRWAQMKWKKTGTVHYILKDTEIPYHLLMPSRFVCLCLCMRWLFVFRAIPMATPIKQY